MNAVVEVDYVVLGGGLAGLAFAREIGSESVAILEKESRPGGLLKSINIDGFWFDAVVHLLYFHNDAIRKHLEQLLTKDFISLPQRANVVTEKGETAFPFQYNLGGLPAQEAVACAVDYVDQLSRQNGDPENFASWLISSFGRRMCEVFFFPYNKKVWKRELTGLASRDFVWTIQQATTKNVLAGLIGSGQGDSYNARSIYPVPPIESSSRGMELLIDLIAAPLSNQLKLGEDVAAIDTLSRTVTVNTLSGEKIYRYRKGCISTLPLPTLLNKVDDPPTDLVDFRSNGVIYAMVMLSEPLQQTEMLSTYFSAPDIVFTRVIYMQNFDPHSAPPGKGSIMVETTFRTEDGPGDLTLLERQIKLDLLSTEIVKRENDFLNIHLEVHHYGYVVFEHDTPDQIARATEALAAKDIHLLGRYGKWQYINISQGYEEAIVLANELVAKA